ncbi:hypothetical protein BA190_07805 [Labrys sp. WJW]|uniref:hypothetical protein n=1 Tax=Labrys sp. WJW TaxID=1737983 RepID=UPI000834E847|nr:hypothetical protein [Labrys sp. WJW]OCC05336.1 hypothetical protein BA190_07805 [Labrys sp. WJW]
MIIIHSDLDQMSDDAKEPANPPSDPESDERRITLGELTSCTDGKLVVAECIDTGRPRHINDTANGLKCRCVCPGCRRRMVAHQGERRRHFQHAAEDVNCSSAGESALHRFAKDVLAKALKLKLPELKAYRGDDSLVVVTEQEFAFDSAVLEQRTGDVIPDVVCWRGGRSLHVEFMVTHACGPEKIDKLKAMDIGAIEIDLSGYRDIPLDDLDQAILTEAPRSWLHNPRQSQVEAKLQENERKRVTSEDRRAEALLKKLKPTEKRSVGEFEQLASDAGVASLLEHEGHDVGFLVDSREWRAFALMRFAVPGSVFRHQQVFEEMKARRWIAPGFNYVSKPDAAAIERVAGRKALPPWQALWAFLSRLGEAGFLNETSTGHVAAKRLREQTEPWRSELEKPQQRKDEIEGLFDSILASIRTGILKEGLTFAGWFAADIGQGLVPAGTIGDDDAFADLSARLEALRRGMSSYPARAEEPLGFPVLEELAIRAEARRKVEQEREVERKARALAEANTREEKLALRATRLLASHHGAAWMDGPLASLSGKTPRETARLSDSGFASASDALDRFKAETDRQIAATELAARLVEKLRREARSAFRDVARSDLWVSSSTHRLGGKRPKDYCIDEATYKECLVLLAVATRRRC